MANEIKFCIICLVVAVLLPVTLFYGIWELVYKPSLEAFQAGFQDYANFRNDLLYGPRILHYTVCQNPSWDPVHQQVLNRFHKANPDDLVADVAAKEYWKKANITITTTVELNGTFANTVSGLSREEINDEACHKLELIAFIIKYNASSLEEERCITMCKPVMEKIHAAVQKDKDTDFRELALNVSADDGICDCLYAHFLVLNNVSITAKLKDASS